MPVKTPNCRQPQTRSTNESVHPDQTKQVTVFIGRRHLLSTPTLRLTRARFLSLTGSKLRLCSANHRPGYWSNLPCYWPNTAWAYSEQETENGPRSPLLFITPQNFINTSLRHTLNASHHTLTIALCWKQDVLWHISRHSAALRAIRA